MDALSTGGWLSSEDNHSAEGRLSAGEGLGALSAGE